MTIPPHILETAYGKTTTAEGGHPMTLRDKIAEAVHEAIDSVHDMDVTFDDYAQASADAILDVIRDSVGKLSWYESPDDDTDFCADAFGLTYVVDCDLNGFCSWGFFRSIGREEGDDSWTIDDAKAAAQADYTRRILSALGVDQ